MSLKPERVALFPKTGLLLACWLPVISGCLSRSEQEVVVYAALDKEFSQPILDDFEQAAEISVLAKYDVESNKTVGLATDIIEHRSRQRCDLFWNNEILHTLRLQKLGLLEPYETPLANHYPGSFVGSDHTWHGFAARARVLIVNTELLADGNSWPASVSELADPKWKGNCGMARPLFGTTASHAAVLFSQWGAARASSFFEQVSQNAVVEGGNKQVARNVARGDYAWGITDTDDAIIEKDAGQPVAIVFPDQADGQPGCLLIPNTLAIIKGGPNTENAKRLVDSLLSEQTEIRLARGPSGQIPLHRKVEEPSRAVDGNVRWMQVDFELAADQWDASRAVLEKLFPVGR
jgi:iron(III) transport system substrate-binding protein